MDFGEIWQVLLGFNGYSTAFRLLLSAVMGGCIGLERGRHGRAAGLRTHILVCMGATTATLVGLYPTFVLGINSDPLRVGAQVISGIGFLGAGTILTKKHAQVTGLTTAAGLWATACVGLAVGIGFYAAAGVAFLIEMVTISALTLLERGKRQKAPEAYYIEATDIGQINQLCDRLSGYASVQIVSAQSGLDAHVGIICTETDQGRGAALLEEARALDYVAIAIPLEGPR